MRSERAGLLKLRSIHPEIATIALSAAADEFDHPRTSIIMAGLASEALTKWIARQMDIEDEHLSHEKRIIKLQFIPLFPATIGEDLHRIRRARNEALHTVDVSLQPSTTILDTLEAVVRWTTKIFPDTFSNASSACDGIIPAKRERTVSNPLASPTKKHKAAFVDGRANSGELDGDPIRGQESILHFAFIDTREKKTLIKRSRGVHTVPSLNTKEAVHSYDQSNFSNICLSFIQDIFPDVTSFHTMYEHEAINPALTMEGDDLTNAVMLSEKFIVAIVKEGASRDIQLAVENAAIQRGGAIRAVYPECGDQINGLSYRGGSNLDIFRKRKLINTFDNHVKYDEILASLSSIEEIEPSVKINSKINSVGILILVPPGQSLIPNELQSEWRWVHPSVWPNLGLDLSSLVTLATALQYVDTG